MRQPTSNFEWVIDDAMMQGEFNPAAYDYASAVERGIESALKQLAERAESKMREYLDGYGLSDSGIMDNMNFTMMDDGISIEMVGDTSGDSKIHRYMFVEFGTGIVGEQGTDHPFMKSPHNIDWSYDTNSHGESGWWYPTVPTDPNPTLERSADGGWVAWTKGQRSRPFMYRTWLYLSRATVPTFKAHIDREIAKMEALQ